MTTLIRDTMRCCAMILGACGLVVTSAAAAQDRTARARDENSAGMRLYQEGRLGEARAHFERAVSLDARYHLALFNLACVLSLTDQLDAAEEHLRLLVLREPGQFLSRLRGDADLERMRRNGQIDRIIRRRGLPAAEYAHVLRALRGEHVRRPTGSVHLSDADGDGRREAFVELATDNDTYVVGAVLADEGLITGVVDYYLAYESNGLEFSEPIAGHFLVARTFGASHQTEGHVSLVRVAGDQIARVWDQHFDLESTCLDEEGSCSASDDYNGQVELTLADLDEDPEPELVLTEVADCDYRRARTRVLDWDGRRFATMSAAGRHVRAATGRLQTAARNGDVEAAEALLRLNPRDREARLAAIRHLEPSRRRAEHLEWFVGMWGRRRLPAALRADVPDSSEVGVCSHGLTVESVSSFR